MSRIRQAISLNIRKWFKDFSGLVTKDSPNLETKRSYLHADISHELEQLNKESRKRTLILMEIQEQQRKELYKLTRSFEDTIQTLTNEIRSDKFLDESDKQIFLNQIESREEIKTLKDEARILRIRELKSFKDYQIFLKSEKIEEMKMITQKNDGLIESSQFVQSELDLIGKFKIILIFNHIPHILNI